MANMILQNNRKTTGVIKRIDYEAFSTRIFNVVCFCKECDPKGEGGHGGYLGSDEYAITNDEVKARYSEFTKFCPSCERIINWDDIERRENYIR